jgi:O-antigen ligase
MKNIYSFLANACQEILEEQKLNKSFLPLLLILITLPTIMAINNASTSIFIISVLFFNRNNKIKTKATLILPIVLYVWMVASYFWTVDISRTITALSKEITLFLIPVVFLIMKPFTKNQILKLLKYYGYAMVFYALFFLLRATIRYSISGDQRAFFYHGEYYDDFGLVPKLLNAIHVSVYVAVAFFYFLSKEIKSKFDVLCASVLFVFVFLLLSKNIILVVILLIFIQIFFYSKIANRMRLRNIVVLLSLLILMFLFGKIKDRFYFEFQSNSEKSISHNVVSGLPKGFHNVSIYQAWNKEKFSPNDFFPGTAFRVYQARLFLEFLKEEPIFWKGFGLNASFVKIEEKGIKYNVFQGNNITEGYQKKNFHNQYIQVFSELGVIGFLLLILILFINLKNAFKNKDFLHIAFAILMLSLFLTESFLWRQRGVVFFTVFYCLFNTTHLNNKE